MNALRAGDRAGCPVVDACAILAVHLIHLAQRTTMKPATALFSAMFFSTLFTAPEAAAASRQRADIPAEFRWDFSAIYPSWEAWEAGMTSLQQKMDAFAAMKGSLAQGPDALLKA